MPGQRLGFRLVLLLVLSAAVLVLGCECPRSEVRGQRSEITDEVEVDTSAHPEESVARLEG
jgi:hypothetical protein